MALKIAVAGLRHNHIYDLCKRATAHPELKIIAACEENPEARNAVDTSIVTITHDSIDTMLNETDCDIVAVGDYYSKRGAIAIEALKKGKHVISDKPLCTRLEELIQIRQLAAGKNLQIGCMLDLRNNPAFVGAREVIQTGQIGEIVATSFGGQHPLLLGKRPDWYFEPGKQGGTINDIAIHAIDIIPWLTGHSFRAITAARTWNAMAPDIPHFKDAAQFMVSLDNNAGICGDVSYAAPDNQGYTSIHYWRFTIWGTEGVMEFGINLDKITVSRHDETEPRYLPLPEGYPGGYLQDFVNAINGIHNDGASTTDSILKAAEVTLKIQHAANTDQTNIPL
ncbi:Gfo/Idh/MocA family oxidoreductase [bacterium]|nr:Gfo/Idh/MocA family oxidoreductase [bacterium]